MKYTFLALFFCFYFCSVIANNYHNQIILEGIDIDNPFWEFGSQKIRQKESDSFFQLIEKWEKQVNILWNRLAYKIKIDINATINDINFYMENDLFIEAYLNYYRHTYAEFIDEVEKNTKEEDDDYDEIDPVILHFILGKLEYLDALYKPIKVRTKNISPLFATTFGTDQKGHYLIINDKLYSSEKINKIYESAISGKPNFYIEPGTAHYVSRIIEYGNLFHFIITQSLSSVVHQHDYFGKMLIMFIFNKKTLTKETQVYGISYILFLSFLEGCMQSKNPFEAAVFVEPFLSSFNQEYVLLWKEFIQDLENCYHEQDLADYKALALSKRRAALLKTNNDDEDDEN